MKSVYENGKKYMYVPLPVNKEDILAGQVVTLTNGGLFMRTEGTGFIDLSNGELLQLDNEGLYPVDCTVTVKDWLDLSNQNR